MRIVILIGLLLLCAGGVFADTLVLQPGSEGKDSFVDQNNPDINYGYVGGLWVGTNMDGAYDYDFSTLLQWDLSALPGGAEVSSAEMGLYCTLFFGASSGNMVLSRITEPWEEGEVTWNNCPSSNDDVSCTASWPAVDSWLAVDVTEFVQGWFGGSIPNYGLIIEPSGVTDTCVVTFVSSDGEESTTRPKLTINYTVNSIQPTSVGMVRALFN